MNRSTAPFRIAAVIALLAFACGKDSTGPGDDGSEYPDPGPGPHFSVVPVPITTLARITPLGYINKVMPTPHTYWLTCDFDILLRSDRPCHREKQQLRAPGSGVVWDLNPAADGFITIEGPPGLFWTFGHVTPAPGLARGNRVEAGQVIATMYYDHGFDFGLVNHGITHDYVSPERYHWGYLHGQHPIEQFPEPLRSQLTALVQTTKTGTPLGSFDWDVPGTASGGWFSPNIPDVQSLNAQYDTAWLWLGKLPEKRTTRIVSAGYLRIGMGLNPLVADPSAPDWEDITPATGRIAIKLWNPKFDTAGPNFDWPGGTILIQLENESRLRFEYFPTHEPVGDFTPNARVYVR